MMYLFNKYGMNVDDVNDGGSDPQKGLNPKILAIVQKNYDAIMVAKAKANAGAIIFRGTNFKEIPIREVNPSARPERQSANTVNLYTLWCSNNPQWVAFPKRNRSVICTTDENYTESFGTTSVVIPLYGNTELGICPAGDFWESFDETWPLGNIANFVVAVNNFFDMNFSNLIKGKTTYDKMIQIFRKADKQMTEAILSKKDPFKGAENYGVKVVLRDWSKIQSFEGVFSKVLDPVKNKFYIQTWENFEKTDDRELWFEAPCLFIESTFWETELDAYLTN